MIDKDIEKKVLKYIKNDIKGFNKPKNKEDRYSDIENYINDAFISLVEFYNNFQVQLYKEDEDGQKTAEHGRGF